MTAERAYQEVNKTLKPAMEEHRINLVGEGTIYERGHRPKFGPANKEK